MSSSSDAAVTDAWSPSLDLTTDGMSRWDPARVQQAIDDGYRAGFESGHADGVASGRRQLEADRDELRRAAGALLASFEAAADRLALAEERASASFAASVAGVAVRLAGAIVQRELSDETIAAVAACERALAALGRHDHIRLRLHPDDIALLDGADLPAHVELQPDPAVRRGDALGHTDDRSVDACIDSALERALLALEGTS